MLKKWEELPKYMRTEAVRPYYESLSRKKFSLYVKRFFDVTVASVMLVLLSPVLLVLAFLIAKDSKGGVFYRQERVTQYGKIGTQVTVQNDNRITKIGEKLRKCRLDELPQLFNIILGDMSFVGTRPESTHYVKCYTPEMYATLLLPAGVTSEASIRYKDEAELLDQAVNVDEVYVKEVLPGKMKYNLEEIRKFSWWREIGTMVRTVVAVVR